jgi:RND family efflux transporter MFP subunit
MTKRKWIVAGLAALVIVAAVIARGFWSPQGAVAQAPGQGQQQNQRVVPVEIASATMRRMPVRIEALGTVTPMASVAIKSRIESTIADVHFADGARVARGDVLFTLDARAIEAQIKQAEGALARERAQLEGAERDVKRYSDLLGRGATTQVNLDNARTQAEMLRGALKAGEATLENLRVQMSYATIRAPISGRISAAAVKAGNFVRPADTAPLATINQIAPVYVAFAVPQRNLPDVQMAIRNESARIEAKMPGDRRVASGTPTMIDNAVDPSTGMVTIRAVIDNEDEMLWPGALVNVSLILRVEDALTVPAVAVQTGQGGSFVFVIRDGAAVVRPVTVARTLDNLAVIGSGLAAGETVVTDGQLLLGEGVKVAPRRKAGS